MKVRYQADADLNEIIVTATVRHAPQIDSRTASAAGLRDLIDLEGLEIAAQAGRLLVTHDQTTDAATVCRVHWRSAESWFTGSAATSHRTRSIRRVDSDLDGDGSRGVAQSYLLSTALKARR